MEKIYDLNSIKANSNNTIKLTKQTEKKLFDLTKPVPNELVIGTFSGIFLISVGLAVWIKIYAKKMGYNKQ